MTDIEIGKEVFMPPASEDVTKTAAAFGQFVAARPLKTKYALLGQFVGSPKTGPQEIRTVVVDQTGKVIFADQAGREAFAGQNQARRSDDVHAVLGQPAD